MTARRRVQRRRRPRRKNPAEGAGGFFLGAAAGGGAFFAASLVNSHFIQQFNNACAPKMQAALAAQAQGSGGMSVGGLADATCPTPAYVWLGTIVLWGAPAVAGYMVGGGAGLLGALAVQAGIVFWGISGIH